MRTKLMTLAAENGFSHAAPVDMNALTPRREVREMCRADPVRTVERQLGLSAGCGTLEDAAAAMGCFDAGVLVQTTGTLTDDFDYEGMEAIQRRHKRAFADFARQARLLLRTACLCQQGRAPCADGVPVRTGPAGSRTKRMSSMEAYGLLVGDVCLRSGLSYNYGPRTMTYTSCLLYTEEVK